MIENEISGRVVEAAIEAHRTLGGPGLLESVYEEALVFELGLAGLKVERQKEIPVFYKGGHLNTKYRLDLLVENKVVVECKATREDHQIFAVQALTYLRLLNLKLALVINFGKPLLKDGIHRIVNGL